MRFVKVLFKIILVLLILIILGGYIFLRTFDLNKYKPLIAQITEEQLGRKLAINGNAELGISFVPTLVLNDVTFANAPWASTETMVSVEKIEITLAVLPLLERKVQIDNISIIRPEINLEIAADGATNWDFSNVKKPSAQQLALLKDQAVATGFISADKADKAAEVIAEKPQALALAGFAANDVLIENGSLVFANQQTGEVISAVLNRFEMSMDSLDAPINATFDALYNNQSIKGEVQLGALNDLLNEIPNFPVKADVAAYGAEVNANGVVNGVLDGNISFDLALDIYNPNGNFGAPEVSLLGRASGTVQKIALTLDKLTVNGNVLTGQVNADLTQKLPFIKAQLNSDFLDVTTLVPAEKKTAFVLPSLISSAQASELVPPTEIPYQYLGVVNAEALVNVANLKINPQLQVQNVSLNAKLNNGILTLNPLSAVVGGGDVSLTATVNASQKSLSSVLTAKNVVLQNLYTPLKANPSSSNFGILDGGKLDADIRLNGRGSNLRQLTDSLSGQVILIAGESVVQTGQLQILTGNFVTQLLNALKIDKNIDKNINMKCAVVRSDVNKGVFTFPKGIVFNGKKLNFVSSGTLNLNNDAIDFSLHPYSGEIVDVNWAQAVSSFLQVKGTLQDPKIVLNDTQAIKTLIGVVTTGGATYLGSQMLLDSDRSPCYTALKGTPYATRFPAPSKTQQATQAVYQGASDAVNDSVTAVSDTAKGAATLVGDGAKDAAADLKASVKDLKNAAQGLLNSFKRQ